MLNRWSRRASLATRVAAAASVSAIIAMIVYSVLLRETVRGVVKGWEAERLGAIAHHVAEMVARDQGADFQETIAAVAEDHLIFGYQVRWEPSGKIGQGESTVTVALENAPGVVVVTAANPLFHNLDRRLWLGCGMLAGGTILVLIAVVHGSVYWGLLRPLKRVKGQLRRMKRGPWTAPAATLGSREIVELANELEAVGHTLDRRISMWVEAERRATYEGVRLDLRNRILPAAREINLLVGDLLAREKFDPEEIHKARRLLLAVEDILRVVRDEETDPPIDRNLHLNLPEEASHV